MIVVEEKVLTLFPLYISPALSQNNLCMIFNISTIVLRIFCGGIEEEILVIFLLSISLAFSQNNLWMILYVPIIAF